MSTQGEGTRASEEALVLQREVADYLDAERALADAPIGEVGERADAYVNHAARIRGLLGAWIDTGHSVGKLQRRTREASESMDPRP